MQRQSSSTISPTRLRRAAAATVVLLLGALPRTARSQCETELLASDGAEGDGAGTSVSMSGDVVVVGAPGDDDMGETSGAAYVFRFDGSSWVEEQKLLASDGGESSVGFGVAMDVEGDIAIVGAGYDDVDGHGDAGSAYVFRFNGSSWVEEQKLTASDGQTLDLFGSAVAISGDTVVVGAGNDGTGSEGHTGGTGHGAAYVFRFDGVTWVQEQKLLPTLPALTVGFGASVDVSGDVIFTGAVWDSAPEDGQGAAYVFRRTGSTWVQEQKLLASDGAEYDRFGNSVAVHGDLAIVGAYQDSDAGLGFGSVYVFRFDGSTWIEETELYGSNSHTNGTFGGSVSVGDDVAVIGARRNTAHGAAHVFRKDTSNWVEEQVLIGSRYDPLGESVSISPFGDVVLAGAPWHSSLAGYSAGAAYVYRLPCAPSECEWDWDLACDDADVCTTDTCTHGACEHTNDAAVCCDSAADCADSDVCTVDTCNGGTCTNAPIGNCCTLSSVCADPSACTADTCNPLTNRCEHSAIPGCCASPADCSDGNACTTDGCNSRSCTNVNIAGCCLLDGDCDDGDACTRDACDGNVCAHVDTCSDPGPDAGIIDAGVDADTTGSDGGTANTDGGIIDSVPLSGSCGCVVAGRARDAGGGWLVLLSLGVLLARRRARCPRLRSMTSTSPICFRRSCSSSRGSSSRPTAPR